MLKIGYIYRCSDSESSRIGDFTRWLFVTPVEILGKTELINLKSGNMIRYRGIRTCEQMIKDFGWFTIEEVGQLNGISELTEYSNRWGTVLWKKGSQPQKLGNTKRYL